MHSLYSFFHFATRGTYFGNIMAWWWAKVQNQCLCTQKCATLFIQAPWCAHEVLNNGQSLKKQLLHGQLWGFGRPRVRPPIMKSFPFTGMAQGTKKWGCKITSRSNIGTISYDFLLPSTEKLEVHLHPVRPLSPIPAQVHLITILFSKISIKPLSKTFCKNPFYLLGLVWRIM